ncbi:MAG: hypothetical protein JEZ10_03590 [Verrucomicrobia bacterium]|nr:hypothetical protein [Verrucomicrobiota bacterium]
MKKTSIALSIIFAFSFATHAQTVGSANIMGYTKVSKPGNGYLTIVGVPFNTTSNKLNDLVDPLQFTGHDSDINQADQLIFFDANTQEYSTYALYDIRSYGSEYAPNTAWKAVADFSYGGASFNPTIEPGSAVWLVGKGSTTDTNVLMAGNVVLSSSRTNNVVAGLQLLANPFSEAVALTNLSLHVNATGHASDINQADQVIVFDTETQSYVTYALYDISSYGAEYEIYTGWKNITDFTFGGAYADAILKIGQGFWVKANNQFTWVETNKYLDNL